MRIYGIGIANSLSPVQGERAGVRGRTLVGNDRPLTPTLSPLSRGEGVCMRRSAILVATLLAGACVFSSQAQIGRAHV